jgi:ribose 5-phosphate isomerase B
MSIYIGCDHAAFEEKEALKNYLLSKKNDVIDCGTFSNERCNYPDFATAVAKKVVSESESFGILICGSGIGVSMVANRYKKVRAALCRSEEDASLSKQHNNANVLCLGARVNTLDELKKITETWLSAEFENGRHQDRVNLFNDIGASL